MIRPVRVLQVMRAAYGAVLLARPEVIADPLLGRPLDQIGRRVARVLGARHLMQAISYGAKTTPPVLALGIGVDTLHASSMLLAARLARGHRRAALSSAAMSGGLALADALASRATNTPSPEHVPFNSKETHRWHRMRHHRSW